MQLIRKARLGLARLEETVLAETTDDVDAGQCPYSSCRRALDWRTQEEARSACPRVHGVVRGVEFACSVARYL